MNTCEKYIINLGGKLSENLSYRFDGYEIVTKDKKKAKKVFIHSSVFEDRKRMSEQFKNMINKLLVLK